jgi:hypothetical protein
VCILEKLNQFLWKEPEKVSGTEELINGSYKKTEKGNVTSINNYLDSF